MNKFDTYLVSVLLRYSGFLVQTHLVGGSLVPLELVPGPGLQVLLVRPVRDLPDGPQQGPVQTQDPLPLQELHTRIYYIIIIITIIIIIIRYYMIRHKNILHYYYYY